MTASHGKSDLAPPQNARLCLAHAFPPIAHHLKKNIFFAPFSFLVSPQTARLCRAHAFPRIGVSFQTF